MLNEPKDRVIKLSYLAARPSLALRTLHEFIPFFARPTDPPSREGGRWETKHFIGMIWPNDLDTNPSLVEFLTKGGR